jgi:hypothetical protein
MRVTGWGGSDIDICPPPPNGWAMLGRRFFFFWFNLFWQEFILNGRSLQKN